MTRDRIVSLRWYFTDDREEMVGPLMKYNYHLIMNAYIEIFAKKTWWRPQLPKDPSQFKQKYIRRQIFHRTYLAAGFWSGSVPGNRHHHP